MLQVGQQSNYYPPARYHDFSGHKVGVFLNM